MIKSAMKHSIGHWRWVVPLSLVVFSWPAEAPAAGAVQLAQTQGMERRNDRRGGRQDNRGDRRGDRQDCRQDEGAVGKDKRNCKQDGRQERREGDSDANG